MINQDRSQVPSDPTKNMSPMNFLVLFLVMLDGCDVENSVFTEKKHPKLRNTHENTFTPTEND